MGRLQIIPHQLLRLVLLGATLSPLAIPVSDAALIPAELEHVISLDGTWRFKLEQPGNVKSPHDPLNVLPPITTPATFEPFYDPDYKDGAYMHDLTVPGNWEMAGYSPATYHQPDNASAFYCRWLAVPDAWHGRRVFVNFNGVRRGLRVEFAAGQRHQCRGGFADNGAYTLIVNKQTSPPQDISSKEVPDLFLTLSSGGQVDGTFRLGSSAP